MNTNTYISIAVSTVLVTGCSTHNLHKNHTVAKSGLAYVETVNDLLDQALMTITDVDSMVLMYVRKSQNKKAIFNQRNLETAALRKEIENFRNSVMLTKDYYQALTELINDPTRENISSSLAELSNAIAQENRDNDTSYTSDYAKEAKIYQLSKMTVSAHYSKRIQDILRKDAPIIGRQLTLQKQQLTGIIAKYEKSLKAGRAIYFKNNVEGPYLSSNPLPANIFKESRREWFEMKQKAPTARELTQAHKAVRKAWKRVLMGNNNLTSVSHMLSDTSKLSNVLKGDVQPASNEANPIIQITADTNTP